MTKLKPTRRDVIDILGEHFDGWNDKRPTFNRIKLNRKVSESGKALLDKELRARFPDYAFIVRDVVWDCINWNRQFVVTAIYFWDRNELTPKFLRKFGN